MALIVSVSYSFTIRIYSCLSLSAAISPVQSLLPWSPPSNPTVCSHQGSQRAPVSTYGGHILPLLRTLHGSHLSGGQKPKSSHEASKIGPSTSLPSPPPCFPSLTALQPHGPPRRFCNSRSMLLLRRVFACAIPSARMSFHLLRVFT